MDQGIDGCGLPTFALALDSVADGCAKFAAAVADDDPAPAAIFGAMVAHPEYVAGTARLDTDLMRIADPPLFAKVGAEGFYTAGIPSLRLGVALKVDDGNVRASEPALLAVLRAIDALSKETLHQLSKYATPQILNTRDESVGHIRTSLQF